MLTSSGNITDFRERILRRLIKFWLSHISSFTWWKQLRPTAWKIVARITSIYRQRLRRVVFIGVTGSCGKTTTKEMIAATLSSRYKGHKSKDNNNTLSGVIRSILLTKSEYTFCVQEFTVGGLGEEIPLEKQFDMFKPQIGVVTTVGDDHIGAHGSREAIAAEKGQLIAALPNNGTAILNADDPLVLGMQSLCQGRILTYGLSPDAMLRAVDIRDDWPNRLSLTVRYRDDSVRVQTRFCGAHLVPNVLAAIAVSQTMGVSLQSAAAALEGLAPIPGRMCPVESQDGVTFICDDVKASVWAIPAALDFMGRATAKRKIIILGTLSDYQGDSSSTYVRVARQAMEVADSVFFVGRWASRSLRAKRHAESQALQAFVTIDHINGFLHGFLKPGDLVLIKGSSRTDHLSRIVSTWLHNPQGQSVETHHADPDNAMIASGAAANSTDSAVLTDQGVSQLIVGLGNPGKRFEQTPHNVGRWTLDVLAELLETSWSKEDLGLVARAQVQDQKVLLVKPAVEMNHTGPWMRRIADQRNLKAQDCVIIQDDLHLPLGVVRNRMSGSSGGHKGMQSVIAAFQSEEIRRVKIGVGLPTDGIPVTKYVLTRFNATERDTVENAVRLAATRVLEMIKKHSLKEALTNL